MELKTEKCFQCLYFDRYFTQGLASFQQTEFGLCKKQQKTIASAEQCEQFKKKPSKRRAKALFECALKNFMTELSEIRKMSEAERNEKANRQK